MRTVAASEWARRGAGGGVSRRYGQRGGGGGGGGERAARRALLRAAADFVRHTRAPRAPLHERRVWVGLTALALLAAGALLAGGAGGDGGARGVRVALPSLEHSVGALPFPAVALCSYNLVSRAAATDYADYLAARGARLGYNYSARAVFARLLHFGALVNYALPPVDLEFADFLRHADPPRGGNVTQVVMQLTRDCTAQLIACGWRGRREPCSSLFASRPTPLGLCCVFNGRYTPEDRATPPRVLDAVGPDQGLFVVVKRDRDNHAYLRKMAVGTELLLFEGEQYPLLEGGALALPARPNESTHVVLAARELRAPAALRYLTERERGCRYRTGGGSYVWCLTRCRRAALRQLCGCVPYQLLPERGDFVCTLNQLACLNKEAAALLPRRAAGAERRRAARGGVGLAGLLALRARLLAHPVQRDGVHHQVLRWLPHLSQLLLARRGGGERVGAASVLQHGGAAPLRARARAAVVRACRVGGRRGGGAGRRAAAAAGAAVLRHAALLVAPARRAPPPAPAPHTLLNVYDTTFPHIESVIHYVSK